MKIMNKFIFPTEHSAPGLRLKCSLFPVTKSRPGPDPIQTKSRLNMPFFEDFDTFSHTKREPA